MLVMATGSSAWASTVLTTDNIGYISVANNGGAFYGITDPASANYGQYNYNFAGGGGGLNQLHMTTTASGTTNANVTYNAVSGSASGNFWLTTTGGKGGNDDLILCAAITGPISNNFSLGIISNGYVATPNFLVRPTITDANWQNNVVNETFNGSDFIYGPQSTRIAQTDQALYNGQGAATGYLMFIDLGVANRNYNTASYGANGGSDQVLFSVNGLYEGNVLAFSLYDYDLIPSNSIPNGDAIGWTTPTATNSFSVIGAGAAPVPIPPAVFLFGSGLSGMFFLKRRRTA